MLSTVKTYELEVAHIAHDNYVSFYMPDNTLKEDVRLPLNKKKAASFK